MKRRKHHGANPRLVKSRAWHRGAATASKVGLAVAAVLAIAPARVPAAAASSDSSALEEIVVTSRKRAENLQDVPLSIDVFTKKDLQNLGIANFEDYAQKVPSISYISVGPGTQLFVMRGVSDGSNPNYANTSSTGFYVDDMSMSESGGQPDLHLYDVERIEILNGPQGTTFGAGAMSGAIRYILNKPNVNEFSAGVDFDGGKIQGGQENWTEEAFVNIPLVDGMLGFRASAFSDSHGGFINNALTTRTWVNGAVSNNSEWARNLYNREHVEGGRAALMWVFSPEWSASLTASFQRQATRGAWDEDPTLAPRTVERFGPELNNFQAKTLDFHLDGDVGIGDLVFASTWWSQPRRQWNEYSQYEQNYNAGARNNPPTGYPGTQEGFTCLNDPYYGGGPFTGCKAPLQFYFYDVNPERLSDELRLQSKAGGRFHWLAGLYWEKTFDKSYSDIYFMPNLQYQGAAFQYYLNYYQLTKPTLPAGQWYSYIDSSYEELQTTEFANITFDITDKLNVEAGIVHFHEDARYTTPNLQFAYGPSTPSFVTSDSHKWDTKFGINYKVADHVMVYADFSQGFRPGGNNAGDPNKCYASNPETGAPGVPPQYTPDTLNNFEFGWKTTSLNGHLLWNGAAYLMKWNQLQALIYDAEVCAAASYNINVGEARIYGMESNIDYKVNENWSLQASANYTDSRVTSAANSNYEPYVNERLPFAPYFSWSWNTRYEQPLSGTLHGYLQFDMSHKGDMWNGLSPDDRNTGLPRILQPSFTISNFRIGLTPAGGKWLAELYVTNLTDRNAIIYSNTGNFDLRETTNEPRVFGLRMNYRWGKEGNSESE
jgi:iron complex outermembrane receptor protein